MTKLNLGGGNFHQNGWTNVDYTFKKTEYKRDPALIDVQHNFMSKKKLPFDDNSVDAVYTEHMIEHLPYGYVGALFMEVHRILKPGMGFRISAPDADILFDRYMDPTVKDIGFSSKLKGYPKIAQFINAICTPILSRGLTKRMEYHFKAKCGEDKIAWLKHLESQVSTTRASQARYPGRHLSWWNFDRLNEVLEASGFRKIKKQAAHSSKLKVFREPYLDNTAPAFSIIVQAAK